MPPLGPSTAQQVNAPLGPSFDASGIPARFFCQTPLGPIGYVKKGGAPLCLWRLKKTVRPTRSPRSDAAAISSTVRPRNDRWLSRRRRRRSLSRSTASWPGRSVWQIGPLLEVEQKTSARVELFRF